MNPLLSITVSTKVWPGSTEASFQLVEERKHWKMHQMQFQTLCTLLQVLSLIGVRIHSVSCPNVDSCPSHTGSLLSSCAFTSRSVSHSRNSFEIEALTKTRIYLCCLFNMDFAAAFSWLWFITIPVKLDFSCGSFEARIHSDCCISHPSQYVWGVIYSTIIHTHSSIDS